MHEDQRLVVLRREVLPPASASPGWGLIAVAATAMSFALAGSLLMVRASAEMARARAEAVAPVPALVPDSFGDPPVLSVRAELVRAASTPPPPSSCGGPVYRAGADGRVEAVFEMCPSGPSGAPGAPATITIVDN